MVLALTLVSSASFSEEFQLRLSWGGGRERQWQGSVALSEGRLSDPRPLGIEADEPGSMWLQDEGGSDARLIIRQRSPRGYDGVDLHVEAPHTAELTVTLTPQEASAKPFTVDIPVADLLDDFVDKEVDDHGNRLLAMRTPGDQLRVDFARETLIFSPGEIFRFTVRPHLLPMPKGGKAKLKVQLLAAGDGEELWTAQADFTAEPEVEIPQAITLPEAEGIYDVVLSVVKNPSWSSAVRRPLQWNKTISERRLQVLVLDRRAPGGSTRAVGQFTPIVEIDPANPRWYERLGKLPQLQQISALSLTGIPSLWKKPLGNNSLQPTRHPLGNLAQLSPSADSPDVSWEAYYLPIEQPGRPHLLEVQYPSNVPQTLGISIVEPNAAGALAPIGLDSGVDVSSTVLASGEKPRMLKHQLLFWPRTATPLLLMTNLRNRAPAVYGKIRVLAGGEHLPWASYITAQPRQRLAAAYLDRPLFPENFGASESFDQWSRRSLDDWKTFYEGGSRLVEYLQFVGYNGLMLTVLADGSTLYPSARLKPTPRYDTGTFFASGQDPLRKDVLEMLFRLFDRERLQLIPALEFAAPLPELEAIVRHGAAEEEGLRWIGPQGKSWQAVHTPHRGLAPYYNILHPRVQQAMAAVLRELLDRYAQHPSFAGVALRLGTNGYAQLPGPQWGLDDATIAQFERDTRVQVPGAGPQRFARRAAFFSGEAHRRVWLRWRAAQLSKFHHRLQAELAEVRPDARLYLVGAEVLEAAEPDNTLRPTLPRRTTLTESLLRVGLDGRHYQAPSPIVFLRPQRIAPSSELPAQAFELEFRQLPDADHFFQGLGATGGLFFHAPREVRVASFDRKSPVQPSYTCLVAQPAPSELQTRRRFVHSLAVSDLQCLFHGGWLMPLGQEAAMCDLLATYRSLPAVKFRQVLTRQASTQPVTVRLGNYAGRTYLYAVNDAPFPTRLRLHLTASAACQLEELSGQRVLSPLEPDGENLVWDVNLNPYDFVSFRLSEAGVKVARFQVFWPQEVQTSLGKEIQQLGTRAAVLRNPPPAEGLENPDFEKPAEKTSAIPHWAMTVRDGVTIQLDPATAKSGKQSVHVTSTGPIACLVSHPFPPPCTGRLRMSVWLRVPNANRQPPLRLAVEGRLNGRNYYRFAPLGQPAPDAPKVDPIGTDWTRCLFKVDDLPLEGLTDLRARFDLMGAGEVWIDDVQLCELFFDPAEHFELKIMLTLANVKLQNGQVAECLRLLEGYWPRFLEENVPLPAAAVPKKIARPATPNKPQTEESPGVIGRVKNLLPESLRF